MHNDELDISEDLVQRLMHDQFPDWADLPLSRVHSAGTDNAIFRLGDELSVRMPRISWSADDPAIEHQWLPRIAPQLPLPVPVPLGLGIPSAEYPWHWTVCTWLPGRTAYEEPLGDLDQAARDLAAFVKALHEIDASGGPPQEAPLAGRGGPLAKRDDAVGKALSDLHGVVDVEAAAAAWRLALETPLWDGQPAWIHGDLQHSNFLVEEGRLSGIIDFGGLGVGDPAADLIPAWSFFGESSRKIYRDVLEVDYATWARGRGWALSVGLIALPYYRDTNPVIMDWSLAAVEAVLADQPSGPSS